MKNQKLKIVLDFDSTITNTAENILYQFIKKYPNSKLISNIALYGSTINSKHHCMRIDKTILQWNFSPYIASEDLDKALSLFNQRETYETLQFYDDYTKDTIIWLANNPKVDLTIVTKTHKDNIRFKQKWIMDNLAEECEELKVAYIDTFDKSKFEADIRIDDKIECLRGYTELLNILFGEYGYNKSYNDINTQGVNIDKTLRIYNWKDLRKKLEVYV